MTWRSPSRRPLIAWIQRLRVITALHDWRRAWVGDLAVCPIGGLARQHRRGGIGPAPRLDRAVGLARSAVDDERRSVQNETLGHCGRGGDRSMGSVACCHAARTPNASSLRPHHGLRCPQHRGPMAARIHWLTSVSIGLSKSIFALGCARIRSPR